MASSTRPACSRRTASSTSPLADGPASIAFQQDHALPKPTSQWKPGETIVDGPYDITIPDKPIAEYGIAIGLYGETMLPLKGVTASGNRILIGKLLMARDGEAVTEVKLGDISAEAAAAAQGKADFTAHLNPEGMRVDFGTVATDGSVKVQRGDHELVVYPYPREKVFRVALDLARLVPEAPKSLESVRVSALSARTQEDLGEVACHEENGRLVFMVGIAKAGRYRVRW